MVDAMTDSNGADLKAAAQTLSRERTLGQRIHAFSNMMSGHYFGRSELVFGVSLPEWRVLRSVLLHPDITQIEIAKAEGLNVMNVSRAVAGLRRKTLVESRTDPDDGRRILLQATPLGDEIGAEIAEREQLVYDAVFGELNRAEVQQLDELLARVNTELREMELPEPPAPTRDWAGILEAVVQSSGA